MANKTLRTLTAGAALTSGDLFLTRQGADTEDKSVTAADIQTFVLGGVTLGTIASQNANSVLITGGTLEYMDSVGLIDSNGDHSLHLITGQNLSADRYLTVNTGNADATIGISGTCSISGVNTGDQTSIVGFSSTKAEFDSACSDGNFLFVGDVTSYTDEMAQDAVGAMVDSTLSYVDGSPSLGVVDNTSTQKIEVTKNSGAVVGTRKQLNFIEGSNVTLTVADDVGNDQVDITIASSSAGAGLGVSYMLGQGAII